MTQKVFRPFSSFVQFLYQIHKYSDNFCSLEDSESTEEKGRSYGSMMMERLTGSSDGRIDHVLQVMTVLLLK